MLKLYSLGVYLKSNCKIFTETGSIILISDIGVGDDALLCFTDLQECCRSDQTPGTGGPQGNWLYPNGSRVLSSRDSHHGFYRNRDRSVVRLNLKNATVTAVIGQFCCEVPDATSSPVTICINVSNSSNFSSPGMVSVDEHCKLPTSTAPVTSISEG